MRAVLAPATAHTHKRKHTHPLTPFLPKQGIVELCALRYRDGERQYVGMQEAALCALRAQLLMALHDLGQTELCNKDPCHKLAWTLDACLKVGGGWIARYCQLSSFPPLPALRASRLAIHMGPGRLLKVGGVYVIFVAIPQG